MHALKHTVPPAKFILEFLEQHAADVTVQDRLREGVTQKLAEHLDKMVYNILAITSTVAEIQDRSKLMASDTGAARKYIEHKCGSRSQAGGGATVLPSEYFGRDSGRYSPQNIGEDRNTVRLDEGLIRNQMGGGGRRGSLSEDDKRRLISPLVAHMKALAREKKVQISKEAKVALEELITQSVICLLIDLETKLKRTSLTASRLSAILATKRHAIMW